MCGKFADITAKFVTQFVLRAGSYKAADDVKV